MATQSIQIGTCGWSYQDWTGVFYPDKLPAAQQLGYYSEHFPVVEVDATFYRSPSLQMVRGWNERTPENFRFCPKVPQAITHDKLLLNCEEETEAFASAVRLLGPKLLCAVLQFGYLNRQAFASQQAFLERLDAYLGKWPKDVQAAVEVRNKAWVNKGLADLLRRYRAVWVISEQAWMPTPLEVVTELDAVTGPFAYVRLLGDRKAVDDLTSKLDHIVIDRSQEIERTASAIVRLAGTVPVMVFVNNHFAGYAPETVRQLREAINRELARSK